MGSLPWYVARSSGLIAWSLLSASVVWGLAITTRFMRGRPRPSWLLDMHRYLGGLATVFVAVHVAAILADTYVHVSPLAVLVPFASRWRPSAIAWGTAGIYLLLAVEVTSLLRARLPKRAWRAIHFASFPLFAVATIHALTAGSDAGSWWMRVAAATAVALVAALTALRAAKGPRSASRAPGHSQPAHSRLTGGAAEPGARWAQRTTTR
jgi:methionine sulfoxide reductase heme-binding subunit